MRLFIKYLASTFAFTLIVYTRLVHANQDINLVEYKGKVIYLDFWASWCKPCKESFPWLNQLHKKYPNLKIVGINLDQNKNDADEFLKKTPAVFDIVYNPSGSLAEKYKVGGMPYSILFNKSGQRHSSHVGFSQKKSAEYLKEIRQLLDQK